MNNSMYCRIIQDRRSSLIFKRQMINDFYLFFLSHTKFVFKVIGSFYRVCCSCNLVFKSFQFLLSYKFLSNKFFYKLFWFQLALLHCPPYKPTGMLQNRMFREFMSCVIYFVLRNKFIFFSKP